MLLILVKLMQSNCFTVISRLGKDSINLTSMKF